MDELIRSQKDPYVSLLLFLGKPSFYTWPESEGLVKYKRPPELAYVIVKIQNLFRSESEVPQVYANDNIFEVETNDVKDLTLKYLSLLHASHYKCSWCGLDLKASLATDKHDNVSFDRIVSVEKGGYISHVDFSNVQIVCYGCNLGKHRCLDSFDYINFHLKMLNNATETRAYYIEMLNKFPHAEAQKQHSDEFIFSFSRFLVKKAALFSEGKCVECDASAVLIDSKLQLRCKEHHNDYEYYKMMIKLKNQVYAQFRSDGNYNVKSVLAVFEEYAQSFRRQLKSPPTEEALAVYESFVEKYRKPGEIIEIFRDPIEPVPSTITLRPYQEDALRLMNERPWDTFLLGATPGSGKTNICLEYAKQIPVVVVLSPLRILAKQTLERAKLTLKTHKCVLIDSEGTRNKSVIESYFREHEKLLLSVTYKSCDVIEDIRLRDGTLLIVDEAHNLYNRYNPDASVTNATFKVVNASKKRLLVTGTPLTTMKEVSDISFSYPLRKAIQDGHVVDYNLVVPSITEVSTNEAVDANSEKRLCKKAAFMLQTMKQYGNRKCIVYLRTKKACTDFLTVFKSICKSKCYTDIILSNVSQKKRAEVIKNFTDSPHISVITSIRILDEAVDIPACDSVFLTESQGKLNGLSGARTFQRAMRAIRLDPTRPEKKALMMIWSEPDYNLQNLLKLFNDSDPEFQSHFYQGYNPPKNPKGTVATKEEEIKREVVIQSKALREAAKEKTALIKDMCQLSLEAMAQFSPTTPYNEQFWDNFDKKLMEMKEKCGAIAKPKTT